MSDRPPSYHSDGEFPNRLNPSRGSLLPASGEPATHPVLPCPPLEIALNILKAKYGLTISPEYLSASSGNPGGTKQAVRLQMPPRSSKKKTQTDAVAISLPPNPVVPNDAKSELSIKVALNETVEQLGISPDAFPFVSIVIAAPPAQKDLRSLTASKALAYPKDRYEIIVARGKQPSVQRNRAVKEAKGSLIYFLDDDSEPYKENLIRGVELFMDEQVQVVGGPNLVPPDSNLLERSFGDVMGSWLAFGPSCARYRKVGKTRSSSEKELILCNMMFRKTAFEKHDGFDEALYPNEENALMDAIAGDGGKLMYDPDFVVNRRPRQSLGAFVKMLMNYGRGRAEQFRLHPTLGSAPNFVPPLFLLYVLIAPFLPVWGLWPLAAYGIVVILQVLAIDFVFPLSLPRLAPLILLSHMFYGAGFWKGLFTRLKPKDQPSNVSVDLERISPA